MVAAFSFTPGKVTGYHEWHDKQENLFIPHILKWPDWFQQQRRESQHLLGQAGILGTGTHSTIKKSIK